MYKVDILLMIAVVECGDLSLFKTEELFEFWFNLSNCAADDKFFDEFEDREQNSITNCITQLEREFKHRGFKPVNLFLLMKENPNSVAKILRSFDLEKLLALGDNLKGLEQTDLIKNFRKLIDERIMQLVPVA